jgi:hypothetical protein
VTGALSQRVRMSLLRRRATACKAGLAVVDATEDDANKQRTPRKGLLTLHPNRAFALLLLVLTRCHADATLACVRGACWCAEMPLGASLVA